MNTVIKQEFTPSLVLYNGTKEIKVSCREWGETVQEDGEIQQMGYMGRMQFREVWKLAGHFQSKYSKKIWERVGVDDSMSDEIAYIYVSNLGYVAVFSKEEGEVIFKNKEGTAQVDLSSENKQKLKDRIIIPQNRKTGCYVCLNVLAETQNSEWDIHRLVAENFLVKPSDAWGVHHIDNNSYNNSVTNLVWVTSEQHIEHHRELHPMSYSR